MALWTALLTATLASASPAPDAVPGAAELTHRRLVRKVPSSGIVASHRPQDSVVHTATAGHKEALVSSDAFWPGGQKGGTQWGINHDFTGHDVSKADALTLKKAKDGLLQQQQEMEVKRQAEEKAQEQAREAEAKKLKDEDNLAEETMDPTVAALGRPPIAQKDWVKPQEKKQPAAAVEEASTVSSEGEKEAEEAAQPPVPDQEGETGPEEPYKAEHEKEREREAGMADQKAGEAKPEAAASEKADRSQHGHHKHHRHHRKTEAKRDNAEATAATAVAPAASSSDQAAADTNAAAATAATSAASSEDSRKGAGVVAPEEGKAAEAPKLEKPAEAPPAEEAPHKHHAHHKRHHKHHKHV